MASSHELSQRISPVSLPGSAVATSRIRLDSSLRRWFSRNLGLWRSRRLYFFADGDVLRVDMMLRIESFSEPIEGEAAYRFSWWPEEDFDFFAKKPRFVPTARSARSTNTNWCSNRTTRSGTSSSTSA